MRLMLKDGAFYPYPEDPEEVKGTMDVRTLFFRRMAIEVEGQDEKWGFQVHSGHTWVAILTEEVGEFAAAVNEERTRDAAHELVQIATVALRAFEQQMNGDGLLLPAWGQCKQTPAQAKEPR